MFKNNTMSARVMIVLMISMLLLSACQKNNNKEKNDTSKPTNVTQKKEETVAKLTEQQAVFKEFWELYDRYYPSFNRKNVNWKSVYDKYYPKIEEGTSDEELFKIFREIMLLIDDGHTSLSFNGKEAMAPDRTNPELMEMYEKNSANKVDFVEASSENSMISYGTLKSNPKIGYINSKVFAPQIEEEKGREEDFEKEAEKFNKTVDNALKYLKDAEGIIVDVRENGGGDGGFAMYLAGRFFKDSPVEFSRKRVKMAAGSDESAFSEWVTEFYEGEKDSRADGGTMASVGPEFNVIKATGDFQFTKPVVVLTSRSTASSGEYFTLAMKTQPHVTTIGNTTFGIFSGSEVVTLKNGKGKWKTVISVQDTEFKYKGEYQGFEGKGVKPDVLLIPTKDQVKSGKDIHIEKAIEIIKSAK